MSSKIESCEKTSIIDDNASSSKGIVNQQTSEQMPSVLSYPVISQQKLFNDQGGGLLPFQFALYNVAMFVLLGLCLAGLYAIGQLLRMFFTPILWAVLLGTVLFPAKRAIGLALDGWLGSLDSLGIPLAVGIVLVPFQCLSSLCNSIFDLAISSYGIRLISAFCALKLTIHWDLVSVAIGFAACIYSLTDGVIEFVLDKRMAVLIVLYGFGFVAYLFVNSPILNPSGSSCSFFPRSNQSSVSASQPDTPPPTPMHGIASKKIVRLFSLPIWLFLLIASFNAIFGPGLLRALAMAGTGGCLVLIAVGRIRVSSEPSIDGAVNAADGSAEVVGDGVDDNSNGGVFGADTTQATLLLDSTAQTTSAAEQGTMPIHQQQSSSLASGVGSALHADTHLRTAASLCALVFVARHDWLLVLIGLLLLVASAFRFCEFIQLAKHSLALFNSHVATQHARQALARLVILLVPGTLRQFVYLLFTSDKLFVSSIKARIDVIATVVVLVLLASGTFVAILLVAIQLHAETAMLVRLGAGVLSSSSAATWLLNRTALAAGNFQIIDSVVDLAYKNGSAWLASSVRSSFTDPKDPVRGEELERQTLLLIDHLYALWENGTAVKRNVSDSDHNSGVFSSAMPHQQDTHRQHEHTGNMTTTSPNSPGLANSTGDSLPDNAQHGNSDNKKKMGTFRHQSPSALPSEPSSQSWWNWLFKLPSSSLVLFFSSSSPSSASAPQQDETDNPAGERTFNGDDGNTATTGARGPRRSGGGGHLIDELGALRSALTQTLLNNMETLATVAQSLWSFLLLNAALLGTILSSTFWLLFMFGAELLNLAIELIVFGTVVFYLLANSPASEGWLPIRLVQRCVDSLLPLLVSSAPSSSVFVVSGPGGSTKTTTEQQHQQKHSANNEDEQVADIELPTSNAHASDSDPVDGSCKGARGSHEFAAGNDGSEEQMIVQTTIAQSVEMAISGVFVLSLKMALFYGFYTYFVSALFALNIVFIPSVFAAVFAAIPLLPPWVVPLIVGSVELWLVHGTGGSPDTPLLLGGNISTPTNATISMTTNGGDLFPTGPTGHGPSNRSWGSDVGTGSVSAGSSTLLGVHIALFACANLAPMFFADPAFYSELKGSHPYLTGLSVVGGLYWLGLQGAIIGPILLCTTIALFNLFSRLVVLAGTGTAVPVINSATVLNSRAIEGQ